MGRITIFSLDDCPHCERTKAAFKQRNIPYLEISLTKHPKKRNDMLSLSDRLTVPQIFLNQTHLGGADETLKVLKTWDNDPNMTPLKYYESFVAGSSDPTDPRLQPSTDPPVVEPPAPPREDKPIPLPDGTLLSVLEMTELLKSILPKNGLNYQMTSYKNSFKANKAVDALHKLLVLDSRDEAVEFGKVLQKHRILDHVVSEHEFADTGSLFFRLQCYQTPNILNSYRIWTERQEQVPEQSPDLSNMALLKRLKKMLNIMISYHTDSDGKINYKKVAMHKDFPAFEEAVCELQIVDFFRMTHGAKLAFSINLYNMMIKYAFAKVGIGNSDLARISFFTNVAFQIGPTVLSFQDLENGILRGNRTAPACLSPQFGSNDDRLGMAMSTVDCRIHFALNCGASSCPPVKDFTVEGIEEELRIVSQAFCEDNEGARISGETLYLSKLFSWYQKDFGTSTKELAETVLTFLRGKKKRELESLLQRGSVKVKYNSYDWSTNASESLSFSGGNVKADKSRFL